MDKDKSRNINDRKTDLDKCIRGTMQVAKAALRSFGVPVTIMVLESRVDGYLALGGSPVNAGWQPSTYVPITPLASR